MKIILMLIIVCGSTYIGSEIKRNLLVKKNIYNQIILLISNYKREIAFLKTDIHKILQNCVEESSPLKPIINEYFNCGKISCTYLNDFEKKEICEFFSKLGKQDIDGELNNLEFYNNLFNEKLKIHTEKNKKYGTFSVKMSALLGGLICILLI